MAKGPDKQEIKAEIREALVQWMLGRFLYSSGCFYDVVDHDRRLVRRVDDKELFYVVLAKSREVCESPSLGSSFHFWDKDVRQVIEHCTALFYSKKDVVRAVGDTPLDGDYSSKPWCINRLPVDFNLPNTIQADAWPEALDAIMDRLPEFYHDLRGRMVSPEMWDILTCFFGRVISEDTPSEEFVYWWGEGGDGKGSLTDLFIRHMPETSVPISHANFESRFGAGTYGDKRFVRIDEAPKGNFFTERVKEVTGGAEFVSVERKGKDAVTVKSRLALMFASNYQPSYEDTMAHRRRFRGIQCVQRTSPARDVKNELEASFSAFLGYCLINYTLHNKRLPINSDGVLSRLAEDSSLRADTWIISNLEYSAGGWMTNTEIQALFDKTNRSRTLTFNAVTQHLRRVLQAQSTDGGIVTDLRRNQVRGWQNIRPKDHGHFVGTGDPYSRYR